nr:zinc finger, CCHC-type [Tanacetum cinerariifolium]
MTSAREIWNFLEEKYIAEKERAYKFMTFKLFEFAMEDNVSILDQVHEFLILVSKFKNLNIKIPEKLLVGAKITKLPSSWHNYRKKLMHTSEDFTLDQIQKHLRIKEETRIREKNLNGALSSKVNYVDSRKNNKEIDKKRKGTWNSSKDNKKEKKSLSDVVRFKCGQKGHIKRYCKNPKKKNQNSNKKGEYANAVEQVDTIEITAMVSEMNIGMIQKLHMASVTTTDDWWYDFGVTTHVCNNRDLFKTYKETEDGHEVMMGDNHTLKVIGSGTVEIQFTSGKKLTLMNVLHAFETFKIYKAEVENQKGEKIQILRSDRGGEYFSIEFSSYCESQESSSAPRRSEKARKERILDPDFIDSQAIIFLVEEAMNSRNFAFWKEAINDEMDSLVSNNTWELSDLPPGFKAIGCRWVFRIKYHTDGSIQTFKARLVIQGFSQRQGVDYFDTYAPVARITSIRVLFALASIYNLPIHRMDVKTVFLNGDLDEEVYMKQPEGFVLPDDILIVGTNMKGINETKKFLPSRFQMKDMNEVDTISGIKNDGRAVAQIEYASAIGCLMYATHCTRPDIAYAVCKLSRYTSNPSQDYWKAIGRVFGYLKRTRQLALCYDCFPVVLDGYSDASWITSSSDSKSTTGRIFTLGGGAVC